MDFDKMRTEAQKEHGCSVLSEISKENGKNIDPAKLFGDLSPIYTPENVTGSKATPLINVEIKQDGKTAKIDVFSQTPEQISRGTQHNLAWLEIDDATHKVKRVGCENAK